MKIGVCISLDRGGDQGDRLQISMEDMCQDRLVGGKQEIPAINTNDVFIRA